MKTSRMNPDNNRAQSPGWARLVIFIARDPRQELE